MKISHKSTRLFFIALLMLAISPSLVIAQGSGGSSSPKELLAVSAEKDTEIDLRTIPVKAEKDEQFINDVIARAETFNNGADLKEQLNKLSASIDKLDTTSKNTDYEKLPVVRLQTLVEHWNFYDKRLATWRNQLQKLTLPISSDAADLSKIKKYWLSLRESNIDSLTPALLDRIDELLKEINTAETVISVPLSNLLALSQRSNNVSQKVEQGINKSTDYIKNNDISLLRFDSMNLWDAMKSPEKKAPIALQDSLKIELDYANEYNEVYSTRITILRVFYFLVLSGLFYISWKSKSVFLARPELAEYKNTLRRPFSAGLVLIAFFAVILQDDLPLLTQQIILLLIWIPILRLLPRKAYKIVGPWVYMSAVFYALGIIGYLWAEVQFKYRMVLLVTNLLMLATMIWLLWRSSALIQVYKGIWLKIIKVGVAFGFFAVLTSIVCNILGNVSMAEMLTQSTIDSTYLALFLYTSISVLAGFILYIFKAHTINIFASSQHASSLVHLVIKAYKAGLFIYWLIATLNLYRIWTPLSSYWQAFVNYSLSIGKFSITAGSILLFPITVYIAYWIAKTTRALLNEDIFTKVDLPRGVGNSVSSILYYAIIMAGFFIALAAAGFELSQLGLIISALSVGIGFGLQTVVNNFISGLILMLERPIQPGDTIELSGTIGKVRDIGMRATTLTTFEGADVLVPNGMLLSEKMINWTLSNDSRRVDIPVGVSYDSDPEKVLALLSDIAKNTNGVSKFPEPTVLFIGFGDSALNFSVRAWTTNFDNAVFIRSDITVRIYKSFKEAGIEIPFPQRDLHIQSMSPNIFDQMKKGEKNE
jgi:potassium efflux system protein